MVKVVLNRETMKRIVLITMDIFVIIGLFIGIFFEEMFSGTGISEQYINLLTFIKGFAATMAMFYISSKLVEDTGIWKLVDDVRMELKPKDSKQIG